LKVKQKPFFKIHARFLIGGFYEIYQENKNIVESRVSEAGDTQQYTVTA
jgi:hypothetical protein